MLLENNYKELEGYKELKRFIRRHLSAILCNPYFQKKRKISAVVLFVSTKLYRRLVFISEEKKR